METINKLGIAQRITLALVVGVLVLGLSGSFMAVDILKRSAIDAGRERVDANMRVAWSVLLAQGPMPHEIDGKLMSGSRNLDGDAATVDQIHHLVDGACTLFLGDVRVATNVLTASGERATGTRLTAPAVYDAVFLHGKPYRDEAEILGEPYVTAYDPIIDASGRTIGALSVGIKKAELLAPLAPMEYKLWRATLMAAAIAAWIGFLVAEHAIVTPLREEISVMRALADGKTDIALPSLHRHDEIGDIARALAVFQTNTRERDILAQEQREHQANQALANILRLSLTPVPLKEILGDILDEILSLPWIGIQPQAVIFLYDPAADLLRMTAERGACERQRSLCANVQLGQCLCGTAARELRPIYASSGDDQGPSCPVDNGGHAHVCIPFGRQEQLLGLLATRLAAGEQLDPNGQRFLVMAANAIAGVVERKRAEGELRQKAEALERSNADLQQFAYVASHDLKEPLRQVTSYMQLLDRRYTAQLNDEGREFIGFAVDGAKRMRRLIDDLLEWSRVETSGRPLGVVPTERMLALALGNLSTIIEDLGATVAAAPLPAVLGDATQIARVLQNLIGNGLKYHSPDRPPVIHIDVAADPDGWRFSITDNGIGIPPDQHSRIFEMFQRLHGASEYEGTGIGLAICKRIIERHGGKLWVESAAGQLGSSFYFTLPQAPPPEADDAPTSVPTP